MGIDKRFLNKQKKKCKITTIYYLIESYLIARICSAILHYRLRNGSNPIKICTLIAQTEFYMHAFAICYIHDRIWATRV